MGKIMYNGEPYSGSTNNASAISCVDVDGNQSTVQNEIDKNRNDINELNLNIGSYERIYPTYGEKVSNSSRLIVRRNSLTKTCAFIGFFTIGEALTSSDTIMTFDNDNFTNLMGDHQYLMACNNNGAYYPLKMPMNAISIYPDGSQLPEGSYFINGNLFI